MKTLYDNPVHPFFVLTFFISWGAILATFGTAAIPATEEQQEGIGMTILLGPSLSSLILLWFYQNRKGIVDLGRRLFHWKVDIRWYVIALLTAPVTTMASIPPLNVF